MENFKHLIVHFLLHYLIYTTVNLQISYILKTKFNTAKVKAIKQFQLQLYGWQLSNRIAMRATHRALPSRQYGLRVKCGPTGMQVRAVSRKLWGLQCPFAWGSWVPI